MTPDSTPFPRRFHPMSWALVGLVALAGCNGRGDFIGSRVLDNCNEVWPVCTTQVGCILGPESYAQGSLPRTFGFIVTLAEPSTVRLSLYIDNATAAGTLTALTFNEVGCRSHVEIDTAGQAFLTESQSQGQFVRDAQLQDVGDHLIEVSSDARADYLVKVDILSARTQ